MAWHVETWHASDGLAFVSFRPDDGGPLQIFHLGAPHFQPVPVRGLSTALWAARGTFHEWLVDPNHPRAAIRGGERTAEPPFSELTFPSLSAVIEFVRRAFIAGGFGLNPPARAPLAAAEPSGTVPRVVAGVMSAVSVLDGPTARPQLREALGALAADAGHRLSLQQLAVGALSGMPAPSADGDAADEDRLTYFLLLEKTGLWEGQGNILRDWIQRAGPGGAPNWQLGRVTASGATLQPRLLLGLLFRIPATAAGEGPYAGRLGSLGHHLCAGTADRSYLRALNADGRLAALHLAAVLLAAGTVDLLPGSSRYGKEVLDRANAWLTEHLPDRSLEESAGAEAAITATCLQLAFRP